MQRTWIANFVVAVGGISGYLGIVMVASGLNSTGNPSCMLFPVGFVMSAVIVRWLLPSLPRNRTSAKLLRACVVILAVGVAPFGMIDYDLVSALSPLDWQDSNNLSNYLRSDVVAYSLMTIGLWIAFIGLCLGIAGVVMGRLAPPDGPKYQKTVFLTSVSLFLIGLMGLQAYRLILPRLTLLWTGNVRTGQAMINAIASMGKYAIADGIVLIFSSGLFLFAGLRAPGIGPSGHCRKCGYPLHSTQCPECGEIHSPIPPTMKPSIHQDSKPKGDLGQKAE